MVKRFEQAETRSGETVEHFLFPSTLWVDREPHRIQTILGSCVAVCLFDQILNCGGMNHYMLPWWNGKGVPSPKYGDIAIELLIEKMLQLGSQKCNLVAKVFGGASQYSNNQKSASIGAQNIETAEVKLNQHVIRVLARSVGGTHGRKIVLHTETGQVFMKYLEP